MILLISPAKAQTKLAEHLRLRRLNMSLTQAGLAERSGVPLATVRKFEQKGVISLAGFLKLQMVLGCLEEMVKATQPVKVHFNSIDEVLETDSRPARKRGRRK